MTQSVSNVHINMHVSQHGRQHSGKSWWWYHHHHCHPLEACGPSAPSQSGSPVFFLRDLDGGFSCGELLEAKGSASSLPGEPNIWVFFFFAQGSREGEGSFWSPSPPHTCPPAFPVIDQNLGSEKIILPYPLKCDTREDLYGSRGRL